jgi:hypothetical protein
VSALPRGLDTATITWRDPAATNPRGRLAGDVTFHPFGGIGERSDTHGQGVALNVLGAPNPRSWPANQAVDTMPLRTDGAGNLWAPPYPITVTASDSDPRRTIGAAAGGNGDFKPISRAVRVELTNPSPVASMLIERAVTVRSAALIEPDGEVSYDLIVDDEIEARWALFGCQPYLGGKAVVERNLDDVITSVSVSNTQPIAGLTARYSGTVMLPPITIVPGATASVKVAAGISYIEDASPFEVAAGEMTVVLKGTTLIPADFGDVAAYT